MSADGRFPESSTAAHTHSYLGTLRGLWLWGMLTGQREYLQWVADTYRVTVPRAVLESGFACHDLWKDDPNRGEVGSTSDATQLALWIARDSRATGLLDDVERLVRARLVPAQVTASPPIRAADKDRAAQGADEFARLDERIIGAIGGMQLEPHAGKKHTTDVTAAALHCLTDVFGHIVEHTPRGRHGAVALRLGRRPRAGAGAALRPGGGGCGLCDGTAAGSDKRAHPGASMGAARFTPPDRGREARGATPGGRLRVRAELRSGSRRAPLRAAAPHQP